MKSFLLALSLFWASIFNSHAIASPAHQTAAAAVAESQPSAPELAITSAALPPSSATTTVLLAYNNTPNSNPTPAAPFPANTAPEFVTQNELTAQINDLRALVYSLAGTTTTAFTNPQIAANGDGAYFGETAAPVVQLPASLISGLNASEIPDLSGTYLSLNNGGAVTGTTTIATALGIGTTSPLSALAVSGGVSIGADYNVAAPTNGLTVEKQILVGTTSPLFSFDTSGIDIDSSGGVRVFNNAPTSSQFPGFFVNNYKNGFNGTGQLVFSAFQGSSGAPSALLSGNGIGQVAFDGGIDTAGDNLQTANIAASADENFSSTNAGTHLAFSTTPLGGSSAGVGLPERMRITANGDVGINTTVPAFRLDVKGFGRISTTTFTGTGLNDATAAGTYTGTDISTDTYTIIIQTSSTPDQFEWQKNGGSFTTNVNITGSNQTLTDGVQIKFAATTGHTVGDQWVITATPDNPFGVQNAAGTRAFSVENNGTVGIGTTSPNSLLEVSASNSGTTLTAFSSPSIAITNRSTTNSTFGSLLFQTQSTNGASSTVAQISGIATSHTNGAVSGNLAFLVDNAGTLTQAAQFTNAGNFGIGTTTPYARLSVWGPDSASSTLAINVVNSASTTVLAVFDGGNAQLSGTLTQSSDQRLKTNIESLDASSSLSLIDELNPITFTWIDPNQGTTPQLGFIAQQVQEIFPNLVSTTSATALTPGGTLGLNYIGLISPIVSAIQALYVDIRNLEQSVASFAISITSQTITATNQLCIDKSDGTPICITGDQLAALLAADSQSPSPAQLSQAGASGTPESVTQNSAATDTPPVIQINGADPAIVQVGATYNDLGATITGPQPDLNLGIHTFLNGSLMNPLAIDTTAPATDTIDYVVTDQNGFTSTSTRTVIIQAPSGPGASSTDATIDSQ